MDTTAGSPASGEEREPLVDVTDWSLAELVHSDDTVLAAALRRLLSEIDRPQEIIAAFQSYVR